MKKYFLFVCLTIMGLGIWSCKDDNNDPGKETLKTIELLTPEDNVSIDLNTTASINFDWKDVPGIAPYQLVLSAANDLSAPQTVDLSTGTSVQAVALDALLESLGIGEGESGTVYWSIFPKNAAQKANTQVRKFTLTRLFAGEITGVVSISASKSVVLEYPGTDRIKFEWTENMPAGAKLIISKNSNLSSPVLEIDAAGTVKLIPHAVLEAAIEKADNGLKRYKANTLYWNVKNSSQSAASSNGTLVLSGMRVLVDTRGDEMNIYKVAVIDEPGYQGIWLAEDLRTARFADNFSLVEDIPLGVMEPDAHVAPGHGSIWYYELPLRAPVSGHNDNVILPEARNPQSVYYEVSWEGKLHDNAWNNPWQLPWTKLKRLAPANWKVPACQEWTSLYEAARATGSGDKVLKDPAIFNDNTYGAWKINLAPNGQMICTYNWAEPHNSPYTEYKGDAIFTYVIDPSISGDVSQGEFPVPYENNDPGTNGSVLTYNSVAADSPYYVTSGAAAIRLKYTGDEE